MDRRTFLTIPFLLLAGTHGPARHVRYCVVWAGHADREYAEGIILGEDKYQIKVKTDGKITWIRHDQVVKRW